MGVRETISNRRHWGIGAAVALIAVAVGAIVYQRADGTPERSTGMQAYFSIDDGQSYFEAPADSLPPFDHNGKPAIRAYVFKCDGKKFVGYLERYRPEARQAMAA